MHGVRRPGKMCFLSQMNTRQAAGGTQTWKKTWTDKVFFWPDGHARQHGALLQPPDERAPTAEHSLPLGSLSVFRVSLNGRLPLGNLIPEITSHAGVFQNRYHTRYSDSGSRGYTQCGRI